MKKYCSSVGEFINVVAKMGRSLKMATDECIKQILRTFKFFVDY